MICKIYGFVDLLTAVVLFFGLYGLPSIIKFAIIIVLLIKGVPSLIADVIGKLYGVIDILAAVFLYTGGLPIPDFIRFLIISILAFKGILSMLG